MNYDQFHSIFSDAICTVLDFDQASYDAAECRSIFNWPRSEAAYDRLTDLETGMLLAHKPLRMLTMTGMLKMALCGRNSTAEAFRVWVAGEVFPSIMLSGRYNVDDFYEARETSSDWLRPASRSSFKIAAAALSALRGETDEERYFQDWMVGEVLLPLLEDGSVTIDMNGDSVTIVFEQLADLAFR